MSNRPLESLKETANQLAHLIYTGSKHNEKKHQLEQQLNAALPGASKPGSQPGPGLNQTADEQRRVGIWKPTLIEGKRYYVRDVKYKGEFQDWARVHEIPPKGSKKRIVFTGESVARGFLLDPFFTPAEALETFLNIKPGELQAEVIDIARNNALMPEMKKIASAAFELQPDVLVVFAGNNWINGFKLTEDDLERMVAAMESEERFTGIRRILEEKYRDMTASFIDTLDDLAKSHGVPVVLIIPEFNLMDFRSNWYTRLVTWPTGESERWANLTEEAESALVNGDLEKAEQLSKEMIGLNEGNPLGYELVARCKLKSGSNPEAVEWLRKALDTVILRMIGVPSCVSIIQETLRKGAAGRELQVVDLPRVFELHSSGAPPGEDLFLDYCHLTVEGTHIAMAATAQRLFSILAEKEVPFEHLMEKKQPVDNDVVARAHFFAAVHNAHRGDQPYDVLYQHCLKALDASKDAVELMKIYVDMTSRHTVWSLSRSCEELISSAQMDQYQLFLQPHNHYLLDLELVRAMVDALKTVGVNIETEVNDLRKDEHGFKYGKINLLESYYHLTSYLINQRPDGHYYRSYDSKSEFFLVTGNDTDVLLTLTCRVHRKNIKNSKVYVTVNGTAVEEFPAREKWEQRRITVPKEHFKDGVNSIVIKWPPRLKYDDDINWNPDRINEEFFKRMMYPVYGEINAFTAEAVDPGGTGSRPEPGGKNRVSNGSHSEKSGDTPSAEGSVNQKKKTFQDRLAASFLKFKNNIAVEYGTRQLTYGELDRLSDYIANYIITKGIQKGTFIGILLDDRVEFISALIGILKAGCVLVPLDPFLPLARLENMIAAVDTKYVIGDKTNINRFEEGSTQQNRDTEFFVIPRLPSNEENDRWFTIPVVEYGPEDKIYIYFTSGSTGNPKAILGKNKSLLHFIDWEIDTFGIDETFRFSQFIAPGFDAILRDLFVPLCSGGAVCIPAGNELAGSPVELIKWVEKSRVNAIHCVPFLFRILNDDTLTPDNFKSLKFILLSGEKIDPSSLESWYKRFKERIQLVNFWGPTETTMIKTFYFIRPSDVNLERIPIGKPMRGARVIIMDSEMKRCKERVPGQLYIRTPYGTFGYYNEPELNREKFIPNPFNNDPDDKLHVTGDIGMLLPDGNIDFLGRHDRQVKLRGNRVELDGIERIILKGPGIKEAAVIKRITATKNEFLVAFITSDSGESGDEDHIIPALTGYLTKVLPDYAIPAQITKISEIPRTIHGKVDYEMLSAKAKETCPDYEPPSTDMQEVLLGLWREILRIKRIGINDNFFELGGNSLNIMTLISNIYKTFEIRVTIEGIFNNLTIKQQALLLEKEETGEYLSIRPAPRKEYYPFSPGQKRVYVIQQMDLTSVAYNISYNAVLEGEVDRDTMGKVFRELIRRHESFRTSFHVVDGEPVQKVHEEVDFEIEYNPDGTDGDLRKAINDFVRPFDFAKAPLMRVGLMKLPGEHEHLLMLDMHHIIGDGNSIGILVKDFMALYNGEELPYLSIQYKDYSEWLNSEETKEQFHKQEDYWLSEFKEAGPGLNLPYDYKKPAEMSNEGDIQGFRIENEDTAGLRALALAQNVTMFQLLLAIFNVMLAKVCGREDIALGTAIAGRRYTELQNVIGLFANTLVIRSRPEGGKVFTEFLQEIKEKTLQAFENQDYPFGNLVEKLSVKKQAGSNPLFDVQFQMENENIPRVEIPGLVLKPYMDGMRIAKLDLFLNVVDTTDVLLFSLFYKTRLFKRETVEKLFLYLKNIVSSILENPGNKLSDIEILPDDEVKSKLSHFNVDLEDEQVQYN